MDYVDSYTGRVWSLATTTEYLDTWSDRRQSLSGAWEGWGQPVKSGSIYGNVQTQFFLKGYPLVSVNTVQENVAGVSSESWITRSSGYGQDFLIYREEGVIRFIRNFPQPGLRNMRFLYTYGNNSVPADIILATNYLAATRVIDMIKRGSDQEGLGSVSVGAARYDFSDLERQRARLWEQAHIILDNKKRTLFGRSL